MSITTISLNLAGIEAHAKTLADARNVLSERVADLQAELEATKRRRLPGIKSAVAAAIEAKATLEASIARAPGLFEDPRTIIVHGIRVGFMKGKGKIEWADEKSVVARIKQHFPDQAKVLIKVLEKVQKKALAGLSTADLKRIGCTVGEVGDVVYIKPVDDEVDRLVAKLLDEEGAADDEN
jgi:hypothetical protein